MITKTVAIYFCHRGGEVNKQPDIIVPITPGYDPLIYGDVPYSGRYFFVVLKELANQSEIKEVKWGFMGSDFGHYFNALYS